MKKRMLSLLICVMMILSVAVFTVWAEESEIVPITVYADQTTNVESTNYSSVETTSVSSAESGLFYVNSNIHYEVLIEKAGQYTIDITGRPSSYAYTTVAVLLDGSLQCTASIYGQSGGNKTTTTRVLDLPEGRHKLTIVIKGNMHAYIDNFAVKPYIQKELVTDKTGAFKEAWIPTVIQAEDFDWDSKANDFENKSKKYREGVALDIYASGESGYYVSLKEGEEAKYSFNADVADAYYFSGKVSGGKVEVYFDGNSLPLVIHPDKEESSSQGIWLDEGVHTMSVKAIDGSADIDYFRFKSGATNYVTTDNLGSVELKPAEEIEAVHPIYKELYVSASGSDSASGEKDAPFKTIGRAKEEVKKISAQMTGDIIVNVASGYYEIKESIKFGVDDSGKNGFDVIYRGVDKENPPMLSGGREVTGWQKYNDHLWRAAAPKDIEHVRNLYVNNYPAVRARSKYFYKYDNTYDDPSTEYKKDGMWVPYENFPKNLTNHSDIELVWELDWSSQYTLVEEIIYDHNAKTVLFKMDGYSFNTNTGISATMPAPGKVFSIENAFELLDEKGEFYYNKADGYIYYYPHDEENMETAETYVGKSQQMIMIEGNSVKDRVENIKFDNFEIRYGAWDRASEYGFFTSQADSVVTSYSNSGITSSMMLPAQITVQRANNIEITNCRLSCLGSGAISVPDAATDVVIEGNLIKDVSGSGIIVGSWIHATESPDREMVKNITVKNNIIHRPCGEFRDSMGIVLYYASHVDVIHNDVYYTPYTGMSIGWGWGTTDPPGYGYFTVNNNKIDSTMTSLIDGAPVYCLGPMRGTEIGYNYLTRSSLNQTIGGVYFDAGTRFVRSHHNLVTDSPSWYMWSGWHGIIDVRVDSYYSTTEKTTGPGDLKSIDLEFPTKIDENEELWPEEAKEIKANAGVEDEYKHLLDIAHFPDWKKERLSDYSDKKLYSTRKIGWIEAEDFLPGEGIGWYKIEPKYDSNPYRPEEGVSLYDSVAFGSYVIDTNFDGEWVKYEFDVEKAGEYYFDLSYGHGYGDTDAASKTTIWIDDEILVQDYKLPGDSWSKLREIQLGKKYLEPGKHTFKLMIQVNGFYVDAWRFHDGSGYVVKESGLWGNEEAYDEGIIK